MRNMKRMMALLGAATVVLSQGQAADTTSQTNTAASITAASPTSAVATNLFPDRVLAKGKGFEIKASEVEEIYTGYKAAKAAQNTPVPEASRLQLEASILDDLVVGRILMLRATDADKEKAKPKHEEYLVRLKKNFPNEEAFGRWVKANGMSLDQFMKRSTEMAVRREVIDREVKSKVVITPDRIKKYYQDNSTNYNIADQVKASHILIATKNLASGEDLADAVKKEKRELADKLLERAKKGEDFAKLAKEYTDDAGSKDTGGEYTFGRGKMVPEFEKAAFGLATNQISDIVVTQYGYHIIKVLEKIPPHTVSLEEATKDITDQLAYEEVRNQIPAYVESIKKEAGVEIIKDTPTK